MMLSILPAFLQHPPRSRPVGADAGTDTSVAFPQVSPHSLAHHRSNYVGLLTGGSCIF
jgi:hypothetical protein